MDVKLLLVTNTPEFMRTKVLNCYKSLAFTELGFRVLKYEIEIGPICHSLGDAYLSA